MKKHCIYCSGTHLDVDGCVRSRMARANGECDECHKYDGEHYPECSQSPVRAVHLVDGGCFILHPADEEKYQQQSDKHGDLGAWLIGMDCAKQIGMEWSTEG